MPRILTYDFFTSVHQYGSTIHKIDHKRTELIRQRFLVLVVRAQCGAQVSPKTLALLSEFDMRAWTQGHGELFEKYGRRRACKFCWEWSD